MERTFASEKGCNATKKKNDHILTKDNLILMGIYDEVYKLYIDIREEIVDRLYNCKNISAADVKNSIECFLKANNHLFSSDICIHINRVDYMMLTFDITSVNQRLHKLSVAGFDKFLKKFQEFMCFKLYKSKWEMNNLKYSVDVKYSSVVHDFNNHVQKIIDSKINDNQNNACTEIIEYSLTDTPRKIIWIYGNFHNLKCNRDGHNVKSKIATVTALSDGRTVELPINHCEICGEYYVGQNSLTAIQNKFGVLLIKTQLCTPNQSYDVDFSHFRTESELHSYGYNVIAGKLTETERKKLLTYLLDNNIMNKFEIRRDIEKALNIFRGRPNYIDAIKKWEDDLTFADSYGEDEYVGSGTLAARS